MGLDHPKWKWLFLLALGAIAPWLYIYIQAYWALLLVPIGQFLGVTGKTQMAVHIAAMNLCGAFIAAALLSLPLGYVVRTRAYGFGALLSLAPLTVLFWYRHDEWDATGYLIAIQIAEYLNVVIAFVSMAQLGAYLRTKVET